MKANPWYKDSLALDKFAKSFRFGVPHDVFSTLQIDEGTHALLDHLPARAPQSILDMGCGYGALGLPIAALYPQSDVHMVDRDLLAVEWSRLNAASNQITNAQVYGSLGYRDLKRRDFDWILCNVPARIGEAFIEDLFLSGQKLLNLNGEICVVVIRDLGPTIEAIASRHRIPIREIFHAGKHIVYSLAKISTPILAEISTEQLYRRDRVSISGLEFLRPFDMAGDTIRVDKALPVLIDALPRKDPATVLCFKVAYGVLPVLGAKRWPSAVVVATDRDLLATTFTRENATVHAITPERLTVVDAVDLAAFHDQHRKVFQLIMGEISPAVGARVVESELQLMAKMLSPGGQALLLCGERMVREWVLPAAKKHGLSIAPLITRDSNTVLRLG